MKIAIIDSLALCYSAKYAIPKLYANDEETGILYGFMRYLLALQKKFDFDKFIFCFDSQHSKRLQLYHNYKKNRNNEPLRNMVHSQIQLLEKTILPEIGFRNLFKSIGLEADDIIASICQTKNIDDEYIIISRDGDLFQLLDKNISQYDYVSKKIITEHFLFNQYNIKPDQWGLMKSIGGCKSDNVAGIPGVGIKTIEKYLNETLKKSSKTYQKIESVAGQNIINRNKLLVVLPFEGTPKYEIVKDELNFKKLLEIFIKFDFKSMLTNQSIEQWSESFTWNDIKRKRTKLTDFF